MFVLRGMYDVVVIIRCYRVFASWMSTKVGRSELCAVQRLFSL